MSVFDDMGDWGYCRPCNRLELLDDEGKIIAHSGTSLTQAECIGVGHKPWPEPKEREKYGPQPL